VADWNPEMMEKEGGFRHQHGSMVAHPMADDNPISLEKVGD
jgi:hypothetical protein